MREVTWIVLVAASVVAVGCGGELKSQSAADAGGGADARGPGVDAASSVDTGGRAEDAGADGGGPEVKRDEWTHPNRLDQDRLFVCDGEPASSPARLRRVESFEWAKSIASDEGERVPFLPMAEHAYSTYSSDETIDTPTLSAYLTQNHRGAGSWKDVSGNGHPRLVNLRGAGSLAEEVRCFQWNWNDQPVQEDPTGECVERFVRTLLEDGVYFRPATQAEVDQLVRFTEGQLVKEKADPSIDRRDTIEVVVRAAWMTSSALFRRETGSEPGGEGRSRLADWELGKALSLALTDHATGLSKRGYGSDGYVNKVMLPDVQAAVADGTIGQPDVIARLTRRYMTGTDPAVTSPGEDASDHPPESGAYTDAFWMSSKTRRFFREWLDYDDAAAVFKDTPAASSRFEPVREGVPSYRHGRYIENAYKGARLVGALDDTIARVVAEDRDVLKTLLTTSRYLLPSAPVATGDSSAPYSAFLYDVDTSEAGAVGPDIASRWYVTPKRAGVLTHPAWLAAHGGNFENDPSAIHRGKWVYEELLCGLVPPIPVTVDAQLSLETKGDSARSRLSSQLDDNPQCSACHQYMNPIGYTFEIYNHAGFVRSEDHGEPPSGASVLTSVPAGDSVITSGMEVNDAVDLMSRMSESPRVQRCFVRQAFRHYMGRDETYADACALAQMEEAYDTSGGSMVEMLIALFQSDAFQYRHVEMEAPR